MTRKDLARRIAETQGLPLRQADNIINHLTSDIIEAVARGEEVTLPNFGSFAPTHRQARTMPANGILKEPVNVPAKLAPKFTAAKRFKDTVNGS